MRPNHSLERTVDAEQGELTAQYLGEILKLDDMAEQKILRFQLNLVDGWITD